VFADPINLHDSTGLFAESNSNLPTQGEVNGSRKNGHRGNASQGSARSNRHTKADGYSGGPNGKKKMKYKGGKNNQSFTKKKKKRRKGGRGLGIGLGTSIGLAMWAGEALADALPPLDGPRCFGRGPGEDSLGDGDIPSDGFGGYAAIIAGDIF